MSTTNDIQREAGVKSLIEEALRKESESPGAPSIVIQSWHDADAEPELSVFVGGKRRVLEVSQEFLEDEPDSDTLRKVAAAAREIVHGETRRVQLFHRGVYAVYGDRGP